MKIPKEYGEIVPRRTTFCGNLLGWDVYGPDGEHRGFVEIDVAGPDEDEDPYGEALDLLGLHRPYRGNAVLYTLARLTWDAADPWGSGLKYLDAVCEFMLLTGQGSSIPPECGFSAPYGLGYTLEEARLEGQAAIDLCIPYELTLLAQEEWFGAGFTLGDLVQAARILNRYLDMVRAAGRDY